MIQQSAITQYISRQLPELMPALHTDGDKPLSVYACIGLMLDYTRNKVHEHDLATTRKCFDVAASLYEDGDPAVRRAVENVFVYSLSDLMSDPGSKRSEVMPLLPNHLRDAYIRQVIHHGC